MTKPLETDNSYDILNEEALKFIAVYVAFELKNKYSSLGVKTVQGNLQYFNLYLCFQRIVIVFL